LGRFLQQQEQSCPSDQANGQGGGAEPTLQLATLRLGQLHGKGLLAATHGDTQEQGKSKLVDGPDYPAGAAAVN
jgi:hypothetical protein